MLLTARASPDELSSTDVSIEHGHEGLSPLAAASRSGNVAIVSALVAAKATVDLRMRSQWTVLSEGQTALAIAAEHGQAEVAELLLSAHADPNLASTHIWPYMSPPRNDGRDLIDLIAQPPLLVAARHGHEESCRMLLTYHAAIEFMSSDGVNALGLAALGGHAGAVRACLQFGAFTEVRIGGDTGIHAVGAPTPLQAAAAKGHLEVVHALIQAGANLDYHGEGSPSSLMVASKNNSLEIVRVLLKARAAVDLVSLVYRPQECGDVRVSALDFAVDASHVDVIQMLLEANANVEGARGTTLSACFHYVHPEEAKKGGKRAVRQADAARLLLQYGVQAERASEGVPMLHCAVRGANAACVEMLLDRKVSVNAVDGEGRSALMETTQLWFGRDHRESDRANQVEIARLLLRADADVNIVDHGGKTAIMMAAGSKQHSRSISKDGGWKSNKALVALLKDAGASINGMEADASSDAYFEAASSGANGSEASSASDDSGDGSDAERSEVGSDAEGSEVGSDDDDGNSDADAVAEVHDVS